MSTRAPHGHASAAVSAVYFLGKYIVDQFTIDRFAEYYNKNDRHAMSVVHSWPFSYDLTEKIEESGGFEFVSFQEVRISGDIIRGDFKEENLNILLNGISLSEEPKSFYVSLYPPYTTCLDKLHRKHFSGSLVNFPYDAEGLVEILKRLLRSGEVKSYVTDAHGLTREVPTGFWISAQSEDILRYNVLTNVIYEDYSIFGRISIKLLDIDGLFDTKNIPSQNCMSNSRSLSAPKKRGRPPKFSIPNFMSEANNYIYEAGYPDKLSDFVSNILDLYERAGHPGGRPSDDWAEELLRPTWANRPGAKGGG